MDEFIIIGIWNDYDDTRLITLSELIDLENDSYFTLAQYLDKRYSTNLTRFNFDPFTGEKIDWAEIRKTFIK